MCTLLCVGPPRVEPLFKSCNQIPLAFKVWFSGNSSSRFWTPRLGSLMWGSEPSLQWVDFCDISVLQFVSHPPSGYGILFHCDCAPPTASWRLLLCLWMWGIFFGEFQCLPVNDFQQLAVIPVLSQEGVSGRPSTPPSWTNLCTLPGKNGGGNGSPRFGLRVGSRWSILTEEQKRKEDRGWDGWALLLAGWAGVWTYWGSGSLCLSAEGIQREAKW